MSPILDRCWLAASYDDSVPPFHHVENRTDDRGIVAEGVDAGRQWKDGLDRRQPAILASHVVRGRWNRTERRATNDEFSVAKSNLIGEIRVPARKLRDLHALTTIDVRDQRRRQRVSQPCFESRPVERFAVADRRGVESICVGVLEQDLTLTNLWLPPLAEDPNT
jgi:hypothetical protein